MSLDPAIAAKLKRNDAGLFSAVAQEKSTGDVLMVAWMDDEALARTLETRKDVLFALAAAVLGQGRDLRAHPVRARGAPRL